MADTNQSQNQSQSVDDSIITGNVGFFNLITGTSMAIAYTDLGGNVKVVKNSGIFLGFPWKMQKVAISLIEHKIDTPERTSHTAPSAGTSAGPSIAYDTDYYIKISKPEVFMDKIYGEAKHHPGFSATSKAIRGRIGDRLDQAIRDFIISETYESILKRRAIDVSKELKGGSIPPEFQHLADTITDIEKEYGVSISQFLITVKPPKNLIDQVNATALEAERLKTAEQENIRRMAEAQGEAERKRVAAQAEADREKIKGEALSVNITRMIQAGMTAEQIASQLYAKELVNGTNPNTIVTAASQLGQIAGPQGNTVDMTTVIALMQKMMERSQQPQPGQPQSAPAPAPQPSSTPVTAPRQEIDWSALPDDQYLSVEDSAALAAERGQKIQPGGRYPVCMLRGDEVNRYHAASKGRSK